MDYGQSKNFETHQIFGANNIWGLENLNNVNKLPPNGFTLYNMPYKSKEGSGGPSRVVAILDSMPPSSSSSKMFSNIFVFAIFTTSILAYLE